MNLFFSIISIAGSFGAGYLLKWLTSGIEVCPASLIDQALKEADKNINPSDNLNMLKIITKEKPLTPEDFLKIEEVSAALGKRSDLNEQTKQIFLNNVTLRLYEKRNNKILAQPHYLLESFPSLKKYLYG